MAQTINNRQIIINLLSGSLGSGIDMEKKVAECYTLRLWGSALVDRQSWEGFFTEGLRTWLHIDDASLRLHNIFTEALCSWDPEAEGALSPAGKGELYRLKYSYLPPEESREDAPLRRLEALLNVRSPVREHDGPVHWSQDPLVLHDLSLLKDLCGAEPPPKMDASLLDALFGASFPSCSLQNLKQLIDCIYRYATLKKLPLAHLQPILEKAYNDEAALQEIISQGCLPEGQLAAQERLQAFAAQSAALVATLAVEERRLIFGGTVGRAPKLQMGKAGNVFLSHAQALLEGNPGALAHKIAQAVKASLGQDKGLFLKEVQEQLRGVFQRGIASYIFPQLSQSLLTDRSLGAKILLAPVELCRLGGIKSVALVCEWMTGELSECFTGLLGVDGMQEIYDAAFTGNLETVVNAKLERFLGEALLQVRNSLSQGFFHLSSALPSYISDLVRALDYGDLGEAEQPVWFEFFKQENGKFTLSAFAGGHAMYLQPSLQREDGIAHQIVVQYRDLEPDRLDVEFFQTLYSYKALPQWNVACSFSASTIHNGLLKSLGASPVDLFAEPQAYSLQAAEMGGLWGTAQGFLHYHLNLKTGQEEDAFIFGLRRQSLLDAWKAASTDPTLFASLRSSLKQNAELLIEAAMMRFERGLLPIDELKALYATVWEILQAVQKPKEAPEKKAVIIPKEIAMHLKSFFSSVPQDMVEMVKDLLIGAVGPEAEAVIESFASEMPLSPPQPAPTIGARVESLADAALSIILGISIADFTAPTFWSYVRGALLTVRVAMTIFFPPLGLGLNIAYTVASVARHAIVEAACYFFPEVVRAISREKNRLIGGVIAATVLGENQLACFNAAVGHLRSIVTRSGTISYELLSSRQQAPQQKKFHQILQDVPLAVFPQAVEQAAVSLFAARQEITAENVADVTHEWVEKLKRQAYDDNVSRYLNEQMKNLPVPLPNGQEDCWSQIQDFRGALENMGFLAFALSKSTANSQELSEERRVQVMVNLYKAYAIIDKLARRCEESRLDGFSPNGWALVIWNKAALSRIYDRTSREQLEAVQAYFGVDPEQDAYLDYDSPKVKRLGKNCLFFEHLPSGGVKRHLKSYALEQYLRQFIEDPNVIRKLAAQGIAANDQYTDRIHHLYANPIFNPASLPDDFPQQEKEALSLLFADGGRNPQRRILPRPFRLLQLANFLANHYVLEPCSLFLKSPEDDIVEIQTKDNHVRQVLNTVTFGKMFKDNGASPLDSIPRAKYVIYTVKGKENAWRPLSEVFGSWHLECATVYALQSSNRIFNLSVIGTNFLQMPPRQQNEIINDVLTFDKTRRKRAGFITENIYSFFSKPGWFHNILSDLPPTERRVIEMLRTDPLEQAVRTISYFSQKIGELRDPNFLLFFRILLLQGNVIYSYTQQHPEFAKVLGGFFKRAIGYFEQEKNWLTYLSLIEVAILARAAASAAAPESAAYFPDLRAHLTQIKKGTNLQMAAGNLLALPWLFVDPNEASLAEVAKATRDIALAHNSFLVVNRQDLFAFYQDLFWKWRSAMKTALDSDQDLRNSILTEIAVESGHLAADANPLQWQGEFPAYRSGIITIDLNTCSAVQANNQAMRSFIAAQMQKIFGAQGIPNIEPLDRGCYRIPSQQMGVELRQLPGETLHRLAFFKMHQGEKHYWSIPEDFQDGLTYWVGSSALLVLDNGNVKEVKRLTHTGKPELFELLPDQTVVAQEQCELIDLSVEQHSLGLLSWFEPLSTLRAYRSSVDPQQVRRIEFTTIGIAFNVVDGQAIGEGPLSGLAIATEQMQQEKYPALNQHARYLLLHNSNGSHKVVLPADTLRSALVAWILKKMVKVNTSQFMDSLLDPLLYSNKLDLGVQSSAGYYLYDLNEDGYLTSQDPDAVLYLLCYHLLQSSMADVRRDLLLFEGLGRRKPFSNDIQDFCTQIQLAALGMNDPETTRVALRLGAIAEENHLLQAGNQAQRPGSSAFLSWIALQGNYYADFKRGKHSSHLPFDEYQELFVLMAIIENAKKFIGVKRFDGAVSNFIADLGIDMVAESILVHPRIADRYSFLRDKYALPKEGHAVGVKDVLRSLLMGTSGTGALQQGVWQQSGRGLTAIQLLSSMLSKNVSPKTNLIEKVLEEPELPTSWEEVPLSASHIASKNWAGHKHAYYLLACGKPPKALKDHPEKQTLFAQRRQMLLRMLDLSMGKSFGPELDAWIDLLRLAAELKLSKFPLAEELSEVLLGLRREKLQQPPLSVKEYNLLRDRRRCFMQHLTTACTQGSFLSSFSATPLLSLAKSWSFSVVKETAKLGALSYAAAYVSGAAVPLVPLAASVYQGYSAYRRERYRLRDAAQEAELLNAVVPAEEAPLPQEMHEFLSQEDGLLAEVCLSLLQNHFTHLGGVEGHQEQVAPFDAQSNDGLMQKYFGRLNQSLSDFYDRPPQDFSLYEPQSLDHFYRLWVDLESARKTLQKMLGVLKAGAIAFSRKGSGQEHSDNAVIAGFVRDLREHPGSIDDDVYFHELVQAFGRDDREWIKQRTKIYPGQMQQFEKMMYRYLIHATRLHQLERAGNILAEASKNVESEGFSGLQTKIRLKQLTFELTRKRAYAFDGPSAKLMRANLIFEYGTKTMLWEKQVKQLQEMLLGPEKRVVLQLIMGSGKSFYGIPMTSFFGADRRQTVYNFFPDSLATGCIEQTAGTSSKVFGQASNAFEITRTKPLREGNLLAMLRVFMRAIQRGENFNGRKKDLQALELRFIEEVHRYRKETCGNKKTLFYFMQVLGLIRTKVRANVDEAHALFRRNEELNHPLGDKKQVQENLTLAIIECARHLASSEEIAIHIGLRNSHPAVIDPEFYHEQIKPLLAHRMSQSNIFKIINDQCSTFKEYLCGNLQQIPQFVLDHPKRSEIGLVVGILNKIMPDALQRRVFIEYGPSKLGNGEYARPYNGNDSPIENSTIKNPFEAILKTCIQFLHTRLNCSQVRKFVKRLQEMADAESRKKMISSGETQCVRTFAAWCQNKHALFNFEHDVANEQWIALTNLLNISDNAVLAYVRYCVVPDITYYPQNMKSDSQNFASMFSSFYSDTASPNRDGTMPTGTTVRWDKGTAGDFIDFVCKNCDGGESLRDIEAESPIDSLREILAKLFQYGSKASAIIDSGALFTGLSTEAVAKEMLAFIAEFRPDMKGVVFFNEKQELVIWEQGAGCPIPLSQSSISSKQRLTYYDDVHTFGSDVPQPAEAVGVQTLDASTTLEKYAQGGGRMRGLKTLGQRLIVVVNKKVKQLISRDNPLTIRQVVAFTQKNETSTQGQENYLAARQKIANVTRRAVLDAMIFASDVETMMKVFEHFESFLISESSEDPFLLYGFPEIWTTPQLVFETLKKAQISLLKSSGLFSSAKLEEVRQELAPIGTEENTYPDKVSVYKCQGEIQVGATDLGISQEVAQNQDCAQQVQQNLNQDLQQDLQVDTAPLGQPNYPLRNEPALWNEEIDYFKDASWLQLTKFSAGVDHRKVFFYTVSGSDPSLAHAFKGRMWWSNNFLGIQDVGDIGRVCKPLSCQQKPILELLIVREVQPNGSVRITSGAIDQHEAAMWRRWLAKDRNGPVRNSNLQIGLYDLALQSVVDAGSNGLNDADLMAEPSFRTNLVRWKFLAGQTQIRMELDPEKDQQLLKAGKLWLETKGQDEMKALFVPIYKRFGIQKFTGSDMELLLQKEEV